MTKQNSSFTIEDGQLQISGRQVETEYPVAEALLANGNVVARLQVAVGTIMNANVLCFSENGELLWAIDESPHGGTASNSYVAISLSDNGSIVARNWNGVEYDVSAADGRVSPVGFRRF